MIIKTTGDSAINGLMKTKRAPEMMTMSRPSAKGNIKTSVKVRHGVDSWPGSSRRTRCDVKTSVVL